MHTYGSSNIYKGNDLFIVSSYFILFSYVNIAQKMWEENSNKTDTWLYALYCDVRLYGLILYWCKPWTKGII